MNQQAKELKSIDVPPYPSIRYTSHGFEAFRKPEEENVKKKSPWITINNEDKAEDINAEAEAFIKSMHRKFELAKLMSTKSCYN